MKPKFYGFTDRLPLPGNRQVYTLTGNEAQIEKFMNAKPQLEQNAEAVAGDYPGASLTLPADRQAMAVLALSHTKLEHKLYEIMFDETRRSKTKIGEFSVRYLVERAQNDSYSRIQRARRGLTLKLSIEELTVVSSATRPLVIYTIFSPPEILERRRAKTSAQSRKFWADEAVKDYSWNVVERVIENRSLSRREAQVTLHCAEGMTNHEIGEKLFIHEETVKFHLRNIFLKLGVKRRTELIARLFRH